MALTAAEEAELAALKGGGAPASGLTPEEEAELHALKSQAAPPVQVQETKPVPMSRKLEALVQGTGQGASMGYMPQIQAGVSQALDWRNKKEDEIANMLGMDSAMSKQAQMEKQGFKFPNPETYVEARDRNIRRDQSLAEDAPLAYGAGNVAGVVGSSLAMPTAQLAKIPGLARLAAMGKGGQFAMRALTNPITQGAAEGAALSMASNPGDVEGKVDPLQMDARAENAKTGMEMGGGLQLVSPTLSKIASSAKSAAANAAFKALGPYARQLKKIGMSEDRIQEIGQTLIDKDVVGSGLPFKSHSTIAKNAETAKNAAGVAKGQYMEELDAAGRRATGGEPGMITAEHQFPEAGVDRQKVADQMRTELINPDVDLPGVAKYNKKVEGLIKEFEGGDDKLINMLKAEKSKTALGKMLEESGFWGKLPGQGSTPEQLVQNSARKNLKKGVEDSADFLEQNFNGPEVGKFKKIKQTYGDLKEASSIAKNKQAHEFAKTFAIDTGVGSLGALMGYMGTDNPEKKVDNAILGAGAGALMRLKRNYGSQMSATALKNISKASGVGAKATKQLTKNPWMLMNLINNEKNGEGFKNGKE